MNSVEELLETWGRSASVMHIAHHVAAARCASYNRLFGAVVVAFSAGVASSLFIAAQKSDNQGMIVVAGVASLITSVLTGMHSSLKLDGRAKEHHQAATGFQGLRRELEEELVRCRTGSPRDTYQMIRDRWTAALTAAIPLPPSIHDRVKSQLYADQGAMPYGE